MRGLGYGPRRVQDSPPERGPLAGLLAALALVVLVLTGVQGIWFWLTVDEGPSPAAVEAASQVIRDGYQTGDLILLVPAYATRAREHLGDLHPLAVLDPLAEDFEAHPRVWVLGLFGQAEALRASFATAGLTLAATDTSAPGITVDRYDTGGRDEVTYDFMAHLKDARVWHEKGSTRTACSQWQDVNGQGGRLGRWACPYDRDWFYVAPEWHRMGDHLRLCLWAHPPNEGRLVIQFPDVPLTGRLVGRAGHTLNGSVNARAAVDLDVAVEPEPAQRFSFELEDTWRPYMLATATATTSTVTFAVSSVDAGVNHFCFTAELRRTREAP